MLYSFKCSPSPESDRSAKQRRSRSRHSDEMQKENPQEKELFEVALALEGLTRHASTHAAGVVVSDKPIVEYMPLYVGQEGEIVTQYSMKYVEKTGL